jgi:pilus assembly protein Flp/PilA
MSYLFLNLYARFQDLMNCEEGQDLVEYGMLVALIALALIAGIRNVATEVTTIFTKVSSSLA